MTSAHDPGSVRWEGRQAVTGNIAEQLIKPARALRRVREGHGAGADPRAADQGSRGHRRQGRQDAGEGGVLRLRHPASSERTAAIFR